MVNTETKFENEIEELVSKMTLEEKVAMIHGDGFFRSPGVERLGIPPVMYSDGPMGVRNDFKNAEWFPVGTDDDYVTYLPSNSAIASTWNTELAYEAGKVLGEEARGRGKDMILAPGIDIKRDPRCGRNFEYMSEDPRLIERVCVPMIKGIQENDVSACVKHYAVNNQETNRLQVDTEVDERTLREIYLPGFKAALLEGGSYSIMGAYNKFRGQQCCHNQILLNQILRDEWNYDGFIVSDWGGVHDTKEAAESALDCEMGVIPEFDEYFMANPLLEAVKKGEIAEELLDKKVKNILRFMYRVNMLGDNKDNRKPGIYNTREHVDGAYKVATESFILLKNDTNVLPLNKKEIKTIAVIGANADTRHSHGGGSAEIKSLYEISPLMGLKMEFGGNVKFKYAKGYHVPSKAMNATENWQASSTEENAELEYPYVIHTVPGQYAEINKGLFEEAVEIAKEADAVIFVGGLDHNYDIEGLDRKDILMPYDQDIIIEKLLDVRPDTVVIIHGGAPVEMPWIDKAHSVIWSYYSGLETGRALAKTLVGEINPSAKLAESLPKKLSDTVTYKNGQFGLDDKVVYEEGVFFGYRYYEKEGIEVAFPFGHGLSYTQFKYDNLEIVDKSNGEFDVKFTIENTGDVSGKEIAQVYVGENNPTVPRPVKELKNFTKVELKPGMKTEVSLALTKADFAYYDVDKKDFVTNNGEFTVYVGASSLDIKFSKVVTIK